MCLNRPKERKEVFNEERKNGCTIAYKVFCVDSYGLSFQHMLTQTEKIYVRKWLNEKNYRNNKSYSFIPFSDSANGLYPKGFHAYVTKALAKNAATCSDEIVRKVYLRKVVQRGWQSFKKAIVAKEMFIPRGV